MFLSLSEEYVLQDKTNKLKCAQSDNSDQSVHLYSSLPCPHDHFGSKPSNKYTSIARLLEPEWVTAYRLLGVFYWTHIALLVTY